jgi:outer membrane protein assembly factor BamB
MSVKGRSINSILITPIILFCFLVGGNKFQLSVSQSSTEHLPRWTDQQAPVQEDSRKRLNSNGKMLDVNLQRTNVYDAQGLTEPKAILWKTRKLVTLRSSLFSTTQVGSITIFNDLTTEYDASMLTVAGEELYFSASLGDGYWFIVDRKTGEAKKTLRLKGAGGLSQPVVAGDLLYMGAADGSFRAFDRHTGEPKWQIARKDYRLYHTAPAVVDGVIYFNGVEAINPNGGVHAFDALTGDGKWTLKVKGPGGVAVADGVLYFGADDHNLLAVNAETGQEIWRFEASNYVRTPVIMNGRVFFSDLSNNLYAVDLKSGKELWQVAMKNKMATRLAAYRGLLYFGGRYGNLFAVDVDTGKEKWIYSTFKPCLRPVVANGMVYSATPDNVIFAVNAETGQEKWRYKTKHPLHAPPLVGDGVIYFLDEEGFISALG